MSLRGLTGVKVPYFKRKYISWYISLSLRKSFEEEELQERKAVLLRKGKRQHWVESRRSSGNSSRSAGRRCARHSLRKICSSFEKWGGWLVACLVLDLSIRDEKQDLLNQTENNARQTLRKICSSSEKWRSRSCLGSFNQRWKHKKRKARPSQSNREPVSWSAQHSSKGEFLLRDWLVTGACLDCSNQKQNSTS